MFSNIQNSHILIVDDVSFNRFMIASILEKNNFKNLSFAESGREALNLIQKEHFDLIILDIVMPDVDGFEVCRQVRQYKRHDELPILVQTGLEKANDRTRVFEAGATDLVVKPINVSELLARIRIHLETRCLLEELKSYKLRVESELELAHKTQLDILPQQELIERYETKFGVQIASDFQPITELAGDVWGLIGYDQSIFGVYIVDFSGHGVASALNTFRLQTMMRNQIYIKHPHDILKELNSTLYDILPRGQFATLLYGYFEKGFFKYASSGATKPILFHADGSVVFCESTGTPLGIIKDSEYTLRKIKYKKDSILLLYSDVVSDFFSFLGSPSPEKEIARIVKDIRDPYEMVYKLRQTITKETQTLADDLTLIAIKL